VGFSVELYKIAEVIKDNISTPFMDNEAVVESLFIRISKERDPIGAFIQVRKDYHKKFNSDMMAVITGNMGINKKYHKESIASLLVKIQKSGSNKPFA